MCNFRKGDSAEMAMIEFVDFNNTYSNSNKAASGKTRRSRRSRGGKAKTAASVQSSSEEE